MGRVLACADIGSNTVHLLVAEVEGKKVFRIDNRSEWLGLGEKVARTRVISSGDSQQLIGLLAAYKAAAKSFRSEAFYIFATEAVRVALNHEQVLGRIRKELKKAVHVISPFTEAEYSLRGAAIDTGPFPAMTLFEIGGGSAQIAQVEDARLVTEISLPLGTGRVVAAADLANPCSEEAVERARSHIRGILAGMAPFPWQKPAVASGGVVRGLWRALHPDGERSLAIEEIRYLSWAASRLPAEIASSRFNCRLKRAATLLPGALVYEELMAKAGFDRLLVSEYGIREGAVLTMAKGKLDKWLN